ncbi:MAG: hypothetical protein RIG68_15005 [Imperialibacter sp.]|uniref:hypothetical protein n=1 Tax=Imperialibacter sp. TaxID=2038411 RepID=UPI0032EFF0D6
MANKTKFYHLWDLKSSFITIGVTALLLSVVVIIIYFPQLSRYYKLSKYDNETSGILLDVDEQSIIRQTKLGNKLEIDHYKVRYSYLVGEQEYEKVDFVDGTPVNGQILLNNWKSSKQVLVRYKTGNPAQSMLDLRND